MLRKIIKIDEEKCNGCGLCATACHEGAIDIIDGKAKLVRENYCDGWAIACRVVRQEPSPSRKGRLPNMTIQLLRKRRKKAERRR